MSSEDLEIAEYLRGLLDHESECQTADCAACAALRGLVEVIRKRLFSTTVYAIAGSSAASPDAVELAGFPSTRQRTHFVR